MASVTTSRPPSDSIFIIMDVPERGSPETTMTGFFFLASGGFGAVQFAEHYTNHPVRLAAGIAT